MSATLDVERFRRLLDDPPTIVSEGKSFPLEIELYRPQPDGTDRAADGLGHPLARWAHMKARCSLSFPASPRSSEPPMRSAGSPTTSSFTSCTAASTRRRSARRSRRRQPGKRKLVLATSIAETSVTLADVRIVVDSGLARRPRYDRGAGLTRLVTERASRAAVTQRAGRAARQAPGVAIRLWEEAATASLPAHDPPEILEADLSSLLLTCLLWGEADPARLPFLDPPPAAALAEARSGSSPLAHSTSRGG